jgi:hypothetical protein
MSTKRERLYRCVFSSAAGEHAHHVSAWTPDAASEIFREALARAGIQGPGVLRVTDLRGAVAREEQVRSPAPGA